MWHKNEGTSFFRFVTNRAFDKRQTDGRTAGQLFRKIDRVACNALHATR